MAKVKRETRLIGIREEDIKKMLPPIDGRGVDANYYIWGKCYRREYDGRYREPFKHCDEIIEVWGPNALTPVSHRWKARCIKCKTHWQAESLEELWEMIVIA